MNEPEGGELELDRGQLDRVIRRATELQFGGGDDTADRLSESEVLRIGREVGLAPEHVRRALGELRAESLLPTLPEDQGPVARFVGPARVAASRVVRGRAPAVISTLEDYLARGESLRRVRKREGRSRWEAEEGVVASIQRGLRWGGRTYELARASSVEASVSHLEEGYVLVSLVADLSSERSQNAWGWTFGLGLGGVGAGVGLGIAFATPWLGIPAAAVGAVGGVAAARHEHSKSAERIRLAIEGILDRLEAGEDLMKAGPSWRDRLAPP